MTMGGSAYPLSRGNTNRGGSGMNKKYVQFTSIYLYILHYKLTDGWKGKKGKKRKFKI